VRPESLCPIPVVADSVWKVGYLQLPPRAHSRLLRFLVAKAIDRYERFAYSAEKITGVDR
jgi:hypothetical protein